MTERTDTRTMTDLEARIYLGRIPALPPSLERTGPMLRSVFTADVEAIHHQKFLAVVRLCGPDGLPLPPARRLNQF